MVHRLVDALHVLGDQGRAEVRLRADLETVIAREGGVLAEPLDEGVELLAGHFALAPAEIYPTVFAPRSTANRRCTRALR